MRARERERLTGFKETADDDEDDAAEETEKNRIKEMRVEFLALTATEKLIDSTVTTHNAVRFSRKGGSRT